MRNRSNSDDVKPGPLFETIVSGIIFESKSFLKASIAQDESVDDTLITSSHFEYSSTIMKKRDPWKEPA